MATPLKQALINIVTNLEETITYLASLEHALIENGVLEVGETQSHISAHKKNMAKTRQMISRVPF